MEENEITQKSNEDYAYSLKNTDCFNVGNEFKRKLDGFEGTFVDESVAYAEQISNNLNTIKENLVNLYSLAGTHLTVIKNYVSSANTAHEIHTSFSAVIDHVVKETVADIFGKGDVLTNADQAAQDENNAINDASSECSEFNSDVESKLGDRPVFNSFIPPETGDDTELDTGVFSKAIEQYTDDNNKIFLDIEGTINAINTCQEDIKKAIEEYNGCGKIIGPSSEHCIQNFKDYIKDCKDVLGDKGFKSKIDNFINNVICTELGSIVTESPSNLDSTKYDTIFEHLRTKQGLTGSEAVKKLVGFFDEKYPDWASDSNTSTIFLNYLLDKDVYNKSEAAEFISTCIYNSSCGDEAKAFKVFVNTVGSAVKDGKYAYGIYEGESLTGYDKFLISIPEYTNVSRDGYCYIDIYPYMQPSDGVHKFVEVYNFGNNNGIPLNKIALDEEAVNYAKNNFPDDVIEYCPGSANNNISSIFPYDIDANAIEYANTKGITAASFYPSSFGVASNDNNYGYITVTNDNGVTQIKIDGYQNQIFNTFAGDNEDINKRGIRYIFNDKLTADDSYLNELKGICSEDRNCSLYDNDGNLNIELNESKDGVVYKGTNISVYKIDPDGSKCSMSTGDFNLIDNNELNAFQGSDKYSEFQSVYLGEQSPQQIANAMTENGFFVTAYDGNVVLDNGRFPESANSSKSISLVNVAKFKENIENNEKSESVLTHSSPTQEPESTSTPTQEPESTATPIVVKQSATPTPTVTPVVVKQSATPIVVKQSATPIVVKQSATPTPTVTPVVVKQSATPTPTVTAVVINTETVGDDPVEEGIVEEGTEVPGETTGETQTLTGEETQDFSWQTTTAHPDGSETNIYN